MYLGMVTVGSLSTVTKC